VHPNDHVNMAQSTNDTFPTSMRLSALIMVGELDPVLERLERAFADKAEEFDGIVKSGRTHLQDAVPVRLGQEFGAYAVTIGRCRARILACRDTLGELGIGGTAAGTGINTHPEYRTRMVARLAELTGFVLKNSPDMREAMQSQLPLAEISSALKMLALELIRIANDLRLLSSGPRTGFAEIQLPAVQPGSSIMPGKVNPVMPEVLDMVAFQVVGNDLAVSLAVQAGQLELNVMMPAMSYNVLQSFEILKNTLDVFRKRCLEGITADPARCESYALESVGIATALNRHIGYAAAAEVAKESMRTGKSIYQIVVDRKLLDPDQLKRILEPRAMTEPGIPGKS
jgi:aspartate ammonia-lyase